MIAPPIPWAARARIRNSDEFAAPQRAEAAVKSTTPPTKTFFRPRRSAREPALRTNVARVSA